MRKLGNRKGIKGVWSRIQNWGSARKAAEALQERPGAEGGQQSHISQKNVASVPLSQKAAKV